MHQYCISSSTAFLSETSELSMYAVDQNMGLTQRRVSLALAWIFLCTNSVAAWGKPAKPANITVLLPFSSVYKQLGQASRDGFLLGIEEQAKSLQVRANEYLTSVFIDSRADPKHAAVQVAEAIKNGAQIIGGVVSSAVAIQVQKVVEQHHVPFIIFGAAGTPKVRRKDTLFLRTSFSNYHAPLGLAYWVRDQKIFKKKAIRYACIHADYQAGIDYCDAFKIGYGQAGTEIGRVPIPFRAVDKSRHLVKLKNLQPDFAYAFFAGSDAEIFTKEYYRFRIHQKIPLLSTGDMFSPQLRDAYEKSIKEYGTGKDVYYSYHWSHTLQNAENRSFIEGYRKSFNSIPSQFSLHGYDAGRLLLQGLVNSQGDIKRLITAMRSAKIPSPRTGRPIQFDTHGDPINPEYIFKTTAGPDGKLTVQQVGSIDKINIDEVLKGNSAAH